MTRRSRFLTALVLLLGLAAPSSAYAGVELSEIAGPPFPVKSFLLTLPTRQTLTPDQVVITENGKAATGVSVVPNSQFGGTKFGTVLVVDASSSMHGPAIRSAVSAARAFARQHDPQQPLGVVFFASEPHVALPLTTDAARIDSTLRSVPPVTNGTHLYDAVQTATKMLVDEKVAAGAVVVLSDGTDTGSIATQQSVVNAAQRAHLRIYSIGLRTRAFSRGTLSDLANAAGGSFATATSGGLAALYGRLGTELSNQYIVRFKSTVPSGGSARANVLVHGAGQAHVDYFAPALKLDPALSRASDSFWQSSTATAVAVGGAALLLFLALLVILVPRDSVRSRVGEFISSAAEPNDRVWAMTLIERALGDGRRRGRRVPTIDLIVPTDEELELAQISLTRPQILLIIVVGTLAAGVALALNTGSIVAAPLALLVPYLIRIGVRIKLDRQRKLFDSQLPDNLQVIASAMRAGYTFLGALGTVVVDAPEPSRREFRRVLADEQLGVPLADALTAVANRMGSTDFEHVALVATLQSETGGNTAEVIDQVADTIRERQELRRLISTLTAQGRLAGVVVSGLPVFLLVVIASVSPSYIHPLFHRSAGIAMLIMGTVMLFTGAGVIRKIVNIDV